MASKSDRASVVDENCAPSATAIADPVRMPFFHTVTGRSSRRGTPANRARKCVAWPAFCRSRLSESSYARDVTTFDRDRCCDTRRWGLHRHGHWRRCCHVRSLTAGDGYAHQASGSDLSGERVLRPLLRHVPAREEPSRRTAVRCRQGHAEQQRPDAYPVAPQTRTSPTLRASTVPRRSPVIKTTTTVRSSGHSTMA
jgi:hypothetical protein